MNPFIVSYNLRDIIVRCVYVKAVHSVEMECPNTCLYDTLGSSHSLLVLHSLFAHLLTIGFYFLF